MMSSRGGDPADYQTFRTAFCSWRTLLGQTSTITAAAFEAFYKRKVELVFDAEPGLKPAIFDTTQFPSLFSELPIHSREGLAPLDTGQLPTDWSPASITTQAAANDFTRLLLAFIWKQGDLDKVRHVLTGFRALPRPAGNAVVLWQFGRHLRNPLHEPIFDQHSARHQLLLDKTAFTSSTTFTEYKNLFVSPKARGEGRIPMGQAALTTPERLQRFRVWWDESLGKAPGRGLPADDPSARALAVLWSDRIMFCLGKAAGLVISNHVAKPGPAGAPV